jgi:methyl-accepting chemotaxis protein
LCALPLVVSVMSKLTTLIDTGADKITTWVGSTVSLVVHTAIFAASFSSHWLFGWPFEQILLLVTTIVSLEAIYISIFIQRAVNQQSVRLQEVETTLDEVEESIEDVEESLDEVEKSLDEVEESIDEVEKSLDEVEESIEEEDTQQRETQDSNDALTLEVKKLIKELRTARLAAEKASATKQP